MTEAQHRDYARNLLVEAERTEDKILRMLLLVDIKRHQDIALAMQMALLVNDLGREWADQFIITD